MADAPNIIIESVAAVAQQTGKQVFWDRGPRPYWPQASAAGGRNTSEYDLISGDIGCMWDTGETTPRALFSFGDVLGTNEFQGGDFVAGSTNVGAVKSGAGGSDGLAAPFAFNSSVLNGVATIKVEGLANAAGWNSYGYACIYLPAGVGPASWVIFSYYGLRLGPQATPRTAWLDGCYWIAGSGSVPVDAEVRNGDPRALGGFRSNAILSTLDQNLSNGFTIAAMKDTPTLPPAASPGVATEPWGGVASTPNEMWNASNAGLLGAWKTQVFVTPSAWVFGTYYTLGTTVTYGGLIYTATFSGLSFATPPVDTSRWGLSDRSLAHNLEHVECDASSYCVVGRTNGSSIDAGVGAAQRPKPLRVPLIFGGVPSSVTTLASGTFTHTTVPSSITVTDANAGSGYCVTAKNTAQKQFSVETTTGTYIVVAYTTRTGNVLTGCTYVRGSGTAKAAGQCIQGIENLDGVFNGEKPLYDVKHDGNAYSFRLNTFGQNRAGGDWTSTFVFQSYNRYVDPSTPWYNPLTGQREGNIIVGGCSVSLVGSPAWVSGTSYAYAAPVTSGGVVYVCKLATSGTTAPASDPTHWTRPTDWDGNFTTRRQLAFVWNNWANLNGAYAGTSCDVWSSDDGGYSYVKSSMKWINTPECNALIAVATPCRHTDGYVYAKTSPINHIMKIPETAFRTAPSTWSIATWTHWIDGTGWSATAPANDTDVLNAKQWNDVSYVDGSFGHFAPMNCWYQFYLAFGALVVRFAADPEGPWGPARTVVDPTFLGASQGWPYGGWVHSFSGLYGNDPEALYVNITGFDTYQVFMLKVNLRDLGALFMPEVKRRYTQHMPGSRDEGAWLIDPTFEGYDGWIDSPDVWTRVSPTTDAGGNSCPTFTCPGNAVQVARYSKGCRVSWQEVAGTWKYGNVRSSSHSAGTCTVILFPQNDHQMSATPIPGDTIATIGQGPRYSYEASPEGYPSLWRFLSPTKTGFSTSGGTDLVYFSVIGNRINVDVYYTGTSSAAVHSMIMPCALLQPTETWGTGYGLNSATSVVLAAQWGNYSGGFTCTMNNTPAATAWTTGGVATGKRFSISGQF